MQTWTDPIRQKSGGRSAISDGRFSHLAASLGMSGFVWLRYKKDKVPVSQ